MAVLSFTLTVGWVATGAHPALLAALVAMPGTCSISKPASAVPSLRALMLTHNHGSWVGREGKPICIQQRHGRWHGHGTHATAQHDSCIWTAAAGQNSSQHLQSLNRACEWPRSWCSIFAYESCMLTNPAGSERKISKSAQRTQRWTCRQYRL